MYKILRKLRNPNKALLDTLSYEIETPNILDERDLTEGYTIFRAEDEEDLEMKMCIEELALNR